MSDWIDLGRIVRLQLQRDSLKAGPPGGRWYDPAPLLSVDALYVTADGVALDPTGAPLDVHHARHPQSKNRRGINGVSVCFTSHYARMRERFGAHVTDGIAGENILVESDRHLTLDDFAGGLLLEGGDGRRLELTRVSVAHPCVEFSRFVLGDRLARPALVSETLKFLDGGLRGFYAAVDGVEPWAVRVGDRLLRRAGGD